MAKMNMQNIMKQAAQMQENMAKAQEELSGIKVEGTSGGGMVTVSATAKQELLQIKIDPEVVSPDDVEMLEDLIVAAVNQAMEKASAAAGEHMQKSTGGMLGGLGADMKIPGLGF
jgi:nucleoid-associated protein EbfC